MIYDIYNIYNMYIYIYICIVYKLYISKEHSNGYYFCSYIQCSYYGLQ